ncbi:phosphopantetheine-binding protein [Aestuariirhabdus sp. Z084]|uniref:phosphopantetheine-binding protein n=1 Tax=Aestuariirhabdus haliotis TaxID=2918751 RepID=UPI00201B3557|nr:phosphopantetheine-binding protein [Aestuariirhabdus haliotis]MCL6415858.1 phosphopantetheine-binding protein [Aestuariirhabdus haliotis]MCL6419840.1 phosphopantetheine-binding protein [Aestuariirhabdus haliotis]
MSQFQGIEKEMAELMIEVLNLEDVELDEINPEEPLFGDEGLALDSIDALEIALAVSQNYGIQLKSDDPDNARIFASLRALCAHVEQHRT